MYYLEEVFISENIKMLGFPTLTSNFKDMDHGGDYFLECRHA